MHTPCPKQNHLSILHQMCPNHLNTRSRCVHASSHYISRQFKGGGKPTRPETHPSIHIFRDGIRPSNRVEYLVDHIALHISLSNTFLVSHRQMRQTRPWTELLDDISVDLISDKDKAGIEAILLLKVPDQDRPSLFRGDEGAVAARLKELILQGAGALSPCACPTSPPPTFYHPADLPSIPLVVMLRCCFDL